MKRIASLALALALAASVVTSAFGTTVVYGQWTYGSAYFQAYDSSPLGLWKVVTYYDVRLNGITVETTQPVRCIVQYAIAYSIDITHCAMDTVYVKVTGVAPFYTTYYAKRWRVTDRWTTCFITICAAHGQSLTMTAYGTVTDRSQW